MSPEFRKASAGILAIATALACENSIAAPATLIHDSRIQHSESDCAGIAAALDELRIAHQRFDLATGPVSDSHLDSPVVFACHLGITADSADATRLADWVHQGGGLFATGQSGQGLSAVLGLNSVNLASGADHTEVRFEHSHPLTHGMGWQGDIVSSPPLLSSQLPAVVRHYYDINEPDVDRWPSYVPSPASAQVVGYWRNMNEPWSADDTAPAVTVHAHGEGHAIYSGALAGIYHEWDWPRSWRTLAVNAVEWLASAEPVIELGLWPHGRRAAFSWTGDTEKPAMVTAVPKLLGLFQDLGLQRFGTFYILAQQGGDADTLGAKEHPEIVEQILAAGAEIGGHGDIHTRFLDDDAGTQKLRLQGMLDVIDPMLDPDRVKGFRAPYLSQNSDTWDALRELGLDHDAGDADVWSQVTLPYMLGDLVQLPPSMPMDWHLFEVQELSDAVAEDLWLDKLDYVVARRGLFSWLHHPWVIEGHLGVVENVLRQAMAQGDIWMARQDDVAMWWRLRQQLVIEPLSAGPGMRVVRLSNAGSERVEGAAIWVLVPTGDEGSWAARVEGERVPLIEHGHGDLRFKVAVIRRLEGLESVRVEFILRDSLFRDTFGP